MKRRDFMLCPKCGKEIEETDAICLNCGSLLTSTYKPPVEEDLNTNVEIDNTNIASQIFNEPIQNVGETIQSFNEIKESVVNTDIPNVGEIPNQVEAPILSIDNDVSPLAVTPEQMAAMEMNNITVENTLDNIESNQEITDIKIEQEVENNQPSYTEITNNQNITSYNEFPNSSLNLDNTNQSFESIEPVSMEYNTNTLETEQVEDSIPSVVPIAQEEKEEVKKEKSKKEKIKKEKVKKENNRKKTLCLVLIVIIVLLAVMLGIYFFTSSKAPKKYELNGDSLPSITSIVGNRKMSFSETTNDSEDVIIKKYKYTDVKNVTIDLYEYIQYLTQTLDYVNTTAYDLNEETGTIQFGKESSTDGYVIVLKIEFAPNEYTLTVKKAPGTLTRH